MRRHRRLAERAGRHDPPDRLGAGPAPSDGGDVSIPGSPGWKVVSRMPSPGSSRGWAAARDPMQARRSRRRMCTTSSIPRVMVEGSAPATVYYAGLGATESLRRLLVEGVVAVRYGSQRQQDRVHVQRRRRRRRAAVPHPDPDGRLRVLPEYPGDYRWRTPNVNATVVTLGAWHRIEWYAEIGRHAEMVARRRAAGQLHQRDEFVQLRHVSVQPDMGRQQRRHGRTRPITIGSIMCA